MPAVLTVEDVIERVCRIPSEYHRRGDVGFSTLVRESGYVEHQRAIGIAQLQHYLQAHSDLVQQWALHSDDKRVSRGWYFDSVTLQVGFFTHGKREREQTFSDAAEACAVFIKHELDSVL